MTAKKARMPILNRFKSVQSAIMIPFALLMMAAVIVFLLISLNFTKQAVYENSIESMLQITSQVNEDIDGYIGYMENIASIAARSTDLNEYLFTEDDEEERREERERVLAQFETILESRDDICNIAAVAEDGSYIINTGADELTSYIDIEELDWYKAALESRNGISISSSHVQNAIQSSYEWVITLSRALVDSSTGERAGVFFIDMNYSAISDLCANSGIGSKGYVFIYDGEGNVVYHPKQQLIYGGLLSEDIDALMACTDTYLEMTEDGESKLYAMSVSESTGWTVVSVAYTSELLSSARDAQMLYVFVAAVLILAIVVLSGVLSRKITLPIRKLVHSMEKVQNGDFENIRVEAAANNEIGRLTDAFNDMAARLHESMDRTAQEQEERRKNDLLALQSQIKPHFLYNTLDSIIWMAEAGENEAVVLMTSALARLLRQSINNDREQVTIREEIDYVRSYLIIQKMRYQDKLEYSIDVAEEIQDTMIIKFAVQPLAENAIYHGIKYKKDKGNLRIYGCAEGDTARIEVTDDGVGMDENRLSHLFDENPVRKTENAESGVGVRNVQKRLKLYYGEAYGLQYESEPGKGTRVIIRVPL